MANAFLFRQRVLRQLKTPSDIARYSPVVVMVSFDPAPGAYRRLDRGRRSFRRCRLQSARIAVRLRCERLRSIKNYWQPDWATRISYELAIQLSTINFLKFDLLLWQDRSASQFVQRRRRQPKQCQAPI